MLERSRDWCYSELRWNRPTEASNLDRITGLDRSVCHGGMDSALPKAMRRIGAMGLLTIGLLGCGAATAENGEPRNNQAPVADAGSDITGASTTEEVALDGSQSSDPEDQDMTFSWAIVRPLRVCEGTLRRVSVRRKWTLYQCTER